MCRWRVTAGSVDRLLSALCAGTDTIWLALWYRYRYNRCAMRDPSVERVRRAIAHARAHAGLSLRQLAAASGVPHATIHAIETGRLPRPRWADIAALARTLGLSLDALLDEGAP